MPVVLKVRRWGYGGSQKLDSLNPPSVPIANRRALLPGPQRLKGERHDLGGPRGDVCFFT